MAGGIAEWPGGVNQRRYKGVLNGFAGKHPSDSAGGVDEFVLLYELSSRFELYRRNALGAGRAYQGVEKFPPRRRPTGRGESGADKGDRMIGPDGIHEIRVGWWWERWHIRIPTYQQIRKCEMELGMRP